MTRDELLTALAEAECPRCRDTGVWSKSESIGRGYQLTGGYCDCMAGVRARVEDTPKYSGLTTLIGDRT